MFQINKTKVVRRYGNHLAVYGTVTELWFGTKGVRRVEFTSPGGLVFYSEPEYLEIVNEETWSPSGVEDSSKSTIR